MTITPLQLAAIMACPRERADRWHPHIHAAMAAHHITTNNRIAMWLAQIGHESGSLSQVEENLNYTSATRLRQVFPRYFPTLEIASRYVGKPEQIGSRVYANRIGNGPEQSGDGWRYRGRGLLQITGRANYAEMERMLGQPLVARPEILASPSWAALSAAAWWASRRLNQLADQGKFEQTTRIINGGLNGQTDRTLRYARALSVLR